MRRPTLILTGALFLLTFIIVLYRVIWLEYPFLPTAPGQTWQLLINIRMAPGSEESVLTIGLPLEHTGKTIIEERVFSGRYSFATLKQGPNRIGVWSGEGIPEPQEITYGATILYGYSRNSVSRSPLIGPYRSTLNREEQRLLAELAFTWARLEPAARLKTIAAALHGDWGASRPKETVIRQWGELMEKYHRADIVLALLTAARLPARPAEGLALTEGVHNSTKRWIEVWLGRAWSNLDPETGEISEASAALLPLAVGDLPAASVRGAEVSDIRWILKRQVLSNWSLHFQRIIQSDNLLDRWSLFRLPQEFQLTFRILLLVPIGALIISFLRNVIGLPTFGIFMPMLMALAFRSTGLLYGTIVFAGIIGVGFLVRSVLEKFHLLLVPRLSVILTLVIACFTMLALLGNKLGLREFMAVGLIPFVILTMTIERFFVIVEELGTREALLTTAGSTAVSIITYGIIRWETLQLTFFVFPELLLAVAALQILIGRYTGYRLSELFRFRNLRGPS